MKRTGIFFTHFQGERLKDFPEALGGLLGRDPCGGGLWRKANRYSVWRFEKGNGYLYHPPYHLRFSRAE